MSDDPNTFDAAAEVLDHWIRHLAEFVLSA